MAKEVWTKLKSKSLNWKGCDTFGNVHDTVDWELHANCRLDISSSVKRNRSKLRQQKRESESASGSCEHDQDIISCPALKRLRSGTGQLPFQTISLVLSA